ncbi:flagellar motor switch protein FliG [Planktotalea sp.]|uniref:flagellar motor switch protein FliG n=1 Tax=Planktotalea sp. TaxID=2029877 RepID=UPI003D6AAFB5
MQIGQISSAKHDIKPPARRVNSAEKAAIIVRFLMTEGANVPIGELPEDLQAELTQQMGSLRRIDRETLIQVVEEFANELEQTGLTFPKGVAGALSELDGKISPKAAAQIRKRTGVRASGDPWERLRELDTDKLLALVDDESTEIAAVLISKIDVKKAAKMLGEMPGERARRITYAVSLTNSITPDAVARIGGALIAKIESEPERAFENPPVDRVGAILNSSRSATRDALLDGLNAQDEDFASEVRKAIFTFKHIATRVDARDVSALLRVVDNDTLITALAGATDDLTKPSAEFILANISNRLADQFREAIQERGEVSDEDGETAMSDVVAGIRGLADSGEILLSEEIDA